MSEIRKKEKEFQPDLSSESGVEIRRQILHSLQTHPSLAHHNRDVHIMRAWHGTSMEVAKKILTTGFANLAVLDDGWFGKGMYFSTSPEYLFT